MYGTGASRKSNIFLGRTWKEGQGTPKGRLKSNYHSSVYGMTITRLKRKYCKERWLRTRWGNKSSDCKLARDLISHENIIYTGTKNIRETYDKTVNCSFLSIIHCFTKLCTNIKKITCWLNIPKVGYRVFLGSTTVNTIYPKKCQPVYKVVTIVFHLYVYKTYIIPLMIAAERSYSIE